MECENFQKENFLNAWDILIKRHDMLRIIITDEGKQKVLDSPPKLDIPTQDFSGKEEGLIIGNRLDI